MTGSRGIDRRYAADTVRALRYERQPVLWTIALTGNTAVLLAGPVDMTFSVDTNGVAILRAFAALAPRGCSNSVMT